MELHDSFMELHKSVSSTHRFLSFWHSINIPLLHKIHLVGRQWMHFIYFLMIDTKYLYASLWLHRCRPNIYLLWLELLIWITILTRIGYNWGIESKSPFFMFIIPTRSWWINTKLILILDPLGSDPCVTSDKQTCICASPMFSICHVKPWRWRLLCHTRDQTWWWQYLLVSLAEVFCLTDLYLGIGS